MLTKAAQAPKAEGKPAASDNKAKPPPAKRKRAPKAKGKASSDMGKVSDWLDNLKLPEYKEVFQKYGFDRLEAVAEITADDLASINVKKGHINLIMKQLPKKVYSIPPPIVYATGPPPAGYVPPGYPPGYRPPSAPKEGSASGRASPTSGQPYPPYPYYPPYGYPPYPGQHPHPPYNGPPGIVLYSIP
eukprot:Pgem_evm1s2180